MSLSKQLLSIARTQLVDRFGTSAMFKFGGVVSVDINSAKVFEGVSFSWGKRFICPSSAVGGGVYDIIIDPSGIPDGCIGVFLPISFTAIGAGPIFVDTYIDPIVTPSTGTEVNGVNRDNRLLTQSKTTMTLGPTVTATGTQLPIEFIIASNGISAVATFGGQTKDDLIMVAKKDSKYLFRLTNQEANPANVAVSFTVAEVPEEGVIVT